MSGERVGRLVERMLDEMEALAAQRDWTSVLQRCRVVLAAAPENEDASAFARIAEIELASGRAPAPPAGGDADDAGSHPGETVGRLRALNDIMRLTAASLHIEEVFESIARLLRQLVDFDHVAIGLHHSGDDFVTLHGTVAPDGRPFPGGPRSSLRRSATGEVISTGRVLIRRNLPEDGVYPREFLLARETGLRSTMMLPLRGRDRTRGVLVFGSVIPHRYGDREVQSAQEVADHLAVVVDCGGVCEEATVTATTAERGRLARELHDSLAQTLASIVLALDSAAEELATDSESAVASLNRGRAYARQALEEARYSIWNLQPAALESGSLAGALEREAAHARAAGLDAALHINGDPCDLDARCQEALYRIAQESINNVCRHADASHAAIELEFGKSEVRLLVADDGVGFDPSLTQAAGPGISHGFGLLGIQERARVVGGRAEIRSTPGRGTIIVASIPVVAPSDASLVITPLSAILPPAPAGQERIRVLIVDDHELVRHGIRHMLQREPGLDVVGEAADGEHAIAEVLRLQPDIVLLDVNMPRLDGVDALLRLREMGSGVRTILLSVLADERLFAGLRAGARGYLPKDTGREALARAIRTVYEGGSLLPPVIAAGLLEQLGRSPAEALSTREIEILELLALGARNKEVAAKLSISENTVRWHIANLYQKLAVTTRTEAIHVARQRGLLPR